MKKKVSKNDIKIPPQKPLTKEEKFVCELTWGGIPAESDFAVQTFLFKEKMQEFKNEKFQELWEYEISKSKNKTVH